MFKGDMVAQCTFLREKIDDYILSSSHLVESPWGTDKYQESTVSLS